MPAATIYTNLNTNFAVVLCEQTFCAIAAAAAEVDWTNDPFDRIIVAQSQCNGNSRLVTADELIRGRYEWVVW
jgi:PIN domain nuclease of toxin-antitoxin system